MKKILLTGGTSLIGQAIVDTSPCEIDAPTRAVLNLTDCKSIENFNYSNYDCLILCAGSGMLHGKDRKFLETTSEQIKDIIEVNCFGNTIILKKFLKENDSGIVVVVGSRAIYTLNPNNIVYSASKLFFDKVIESLQKDFKKTRFIKINPGRVNSKNLILDHNIQPKQVASAIWHAIDNNISKIDLFVNQFSDYNQ